MTTVIKYELKHEVCEIGYLRFGATYDHGDIACCKIWRCNTYNPEIITSFDTKEDALAELKNYNSSSWETQGSLGTLLFAEEYWVEANQYYVDEDNELEFDQSFDICEIAPLR